MAAVGLLTAYYQDAGPPVVSDNPTLRKTIIGFAMAFSLVHVSCHRSSRRMSTATGTSVGNNSGTASTVPPFDRRTF